MNKIRKNLIILLILLHTIQVAWSLNFDEQQSAERSIKQISIQLENSLDTSFQSFNKKRKKISQEIQKKYPKQHYYWMSKIDNHFKKRYFLKMSRVLENYDPQTAAQLALNTKNSLSWMSDHLYRIYGRGMYDSQKKSLSLEIAPYYNLIAPLVHEVAHSLDQDLKLVRENLDSIRETEFGRYWFLKEAYMTHYKEIMPRVRACKVYVEMVLASAIPNKSIVDSERYSEAINGNLSCEEITQKEMSHVRKPDFFWMEDTPQWEKVNQYRTQWLNERGLPDPFFTKKGL